MSARTEQLLEEIAKTEQVIVDAKAVGATALADVAAETLKRLQKELTAANADLTEGKQVLKG